MSRKSEILKLISCIDENKYHSRHFFAYVISLNNISYNKWTESKENNLPKYRKRNKIPMTETSTLRPASNSFTIACTGTLGNGVLLVIGNVPNSSKSPPENLVRAVILIPVTK